MDAASSLAQQPQRELGVLGDAPLVPAADGLEVVLADQSHRATEDGRVGLAARALRDVEEVPVGVVEPAEVRRLLPVAVVLRGLDEGQPRVGEERGAPGEEVRVDDVVGVDDANDLGPWVRLGEREVQRTRLVAGPVLEVEELDPLVLAAELLHRTPQRLVGGVVVEHEDLVVLVVEPEQRRQRLDDHVRRLVVRRHVQRDEGARTVLVGLEVDGSFPPAARQQVDELVGVPRGEEEHERLEQQEQQARREAEGPRRLGHHPGDDVPEVEDRGVEPHRPGDHAAGCPSRHQRGPHRQRPGQHERHDGGEERGAAEGGHHRHGDGGHDAGGSPEAALRPRRRGPPRHEQTGGRGSQDEDGRGQTGGEGVEQGQGGLPGRTTGQPSIVPQHARGPAAPPTPRTGGVAR